MFYNQYYSDTILTFWWFLFMQSIISSWFWGEMEDVETLGREILDLTLTRLRMMMGDPNLCSIWSKWSAAMWAYGSAWSTRERKSILIRTALYRSDSVIRFMVRMTWIQSHFNWANEFTFHIMCQITKNKFDNSRKYYSVLCVIKIANVFLGPTKCVLQRPADARDNISISSFK